MKRQFGAVLAVLALAFVPAAWSQSDSGAGDSSSAGASSTSNSASYSTSSPDSSSSGASALGVGVGVGSYGPSGYNDPYYQVAAGDSSQSDSGTDPQNPDDTQTSNGPQSTFTHPELLPPLSSINDITRNTGVALSLNTGSLSDYIWGGKGHPSYWQNIGMWGAGLGFSQIRPTSVISVGYTGGVSLSSMTYGRYSNYMTLNQNANAKIIWNFAKNWQFKLKDNYLYTDNPFEPFLQYTSDPTPNQPNPTVYFPQAVVEQNVGSVDLARRLTSHDTIVFNGSESLQNYIRGTTGLWNSYTWGGGGYYQHAFSPKVAAGVAYNFTAIDFGHGQSRAGVQMVTTFVSYKFNPGLTVSGWIGPEYTTTKDMIPIYCNQFGCLIEEKHGREWDVAEGGTLNYLHSGNNVRFSFSHRVTDGGGILGAVSLYQATLAYSRALSRVWGFAAAVMYNNSDSVSHTFFNQYWTGTQGTINFSRKFGQSFNGAVYLLFINQSQNFYGTPGTTNTAGLGLTVSYLWGHSLGR